MFSEFLAAKGFNKLKVIYDDKIKCLHINPGAAGKHGWHKVQTILKFEIEGSDIKNMEVVELERKSQ